MARVSSGSRASSCLAELITEKPIPKFCFTTTETTRVPSLPLDDSAQCSSLLSRGRKLRNARRIVRLPLEPCQEFCTDEWWFLQTESREREPCLRAEGNLARCNAVRRRRMISRRFPDYLFGVHSACKRRDLWHRRKCMRGPCPVVTGFELQWVVALNPSETLLHPVRRVTSAIQPLNEIYIRTAMSFSLQSSQVFNEISCS